jgi:hypothetical protein
MEIRTIGIDLVKTVFHLVGVKPAATNHQTRQVTTVEQSE